MEQFAPLQSAKATTRFFIFLSLLLLSASFGGIIGNLLIKAVCACEIPEDPTEFLKLATEKPLMVAGIKLSVIASQLLGFAMPALFFARLVNVDVAEELRLENKTNFKSYAVAAVLIAAAIPIINFTHWLNMQIDFAAMWGEVGMQIKKFEEMNNELTKLILPSDGNIGNLLYVIFLIGLIPGICEELVFRGVFQKIFTKAFTNKHAGVWAAAFVFSFAHFQFYGFLPRFILGAVLGYLYMYSRTLWVPILAHAVNNSLGVLFAYFNLDEGETINTDTLGTSATDWIWLTASIIITVGLFIVFKKFNKGNNEQSAEEPI
jgi:membrane protease YdiL (CAAX protease family)